MRRVTLTFDNGPTPGLTDHVLEALGRAGILSTFFVIGRNLVDPSALQLAREAHAIGHWIGNHTLTHTVALGDRPDPAYAATEIGETQALIGDLSRADKLFRPYGNDGLIGPHLLSRAAVSYLLQHRYSCVLWNCVPGDWRDPGGWLDVCMAQVQQQNWAVIVLHDVPDACVDRLPELITRLTDIGVEWQQEFPDSVILTHGGEVRSLLPSYVADCVSASDIRGRVAGPSTSTPFVDDRPGDGRSNAKNSGD